MLAGITLEELYEIRLEEVEERAAKEKEAVVKKAEEKEWKLIRKLLRKNWTVDAIQELTETPMNKILEIQAAINETVAG